MGALINTCQMLNILKLWSSVGLILEKNQALII